MTVAIRNRQRRLKINLRLLAKVAETALDLTERKSTHPRGRSGRGTRRSAPLPTLSDLGIALVSDHEMAELNQQYHKSSGSTDILTFDYGDEQGEIIISVERAVSQAEQFHTTSARELALYVVHGILHLRGNDDRTPTQRRRMRAAERSLLNRIAGSVHLTDLVHNDHASKKQ